MFADPAVTAVTTPDCDTVATAGLSDVQVTGRPVKTAPPASFATAFACVAPPTGRVDDPSVTETVATGTTAAVTVAAASPVWPSTVARIVAVPAATAATTPAEDTVATPGLSDVHVVGRPVS